MDFIGGLYGKWSKTWSSGDTGSGSLRIAQVLDGDAQEGSAAAEAEEPAGECFSDGDCDAEGAGGKSSSSSLGRAFCSDSQRCMPCSEIEVEGGKGGEGSGARSAGIQQVCAAHDNHIVGADECRNRCGCADAYAPNVLTTYTVQSKPATCQELAASGACTHFIFGVAVLRLCPDACSTCPESNFASSSAGLDEAASKLSTKAVAGIAIGILILLTSLLAILLSKRLRQRARIPIVNSAHTATSTFINNTANDEEFNAAVTTFGQVQETILYSDKQGREFSIPTSNSFSFPVGNGGGGGGGDGSGGGAGNTNSSGEHIGFKLTRVPRIQQQQQQQQHRRTGRATGKRKGNTAAFVVPSGNADDVIYSIPMVDLGGSKVVAQDDTEV